MSKKQIVLLSVLFTLIAGGFYMAYRGVQLYHELTRPPVPAAAPTPAPMQPGKQVTSVTLTFSRELVAPPVSTPLPHRPTHRRK